MQAPCFSAQCTAAHCKSRIPLALCSVPRREPALSRRSSLAACRIRNISQASPQPRRLVLTSAGQVSPTSTSRSTDVLRSELKALEAERDTAISTAEASAKTATKLAEMARLLDQLAFDKVQQNDEAGARDALKEKSSVTEAMDKNSAKADINYKLAAVLSTKIATKQSELLAALRPSVSSFSYPHSPPTTSPAVSERSSDESDLNSATSSGDSSRLMWKWQESLVSAKERLRAQETKGAMTDVRMAKLTAAESIATAQARLQAQVSQSVREAQDRLRAAEEGSQGSIAAAQSRLRTRDEEVLAYVRRIMARYRSGNYVSEDELEFAFRQLESRFML